ncbi:VCBS repeat-containing protein [Siphonobacter sp. SORGH_AS_0500]|uniref:VCBS repeat-containing protein n=1 Tax=Siphonobacter sp. SORGH_AS_0500 TaxID=1864824 RepID=UPI00286D5F2D|nr:VCBS repeat-containing protein [Siphonobacter sp. SORGH_AS_0500]
MKYWIFGMLMLFVVACQRSERKRPYEAPDDPIFVGVSVNKTGLDFQNQLPNLDSLYLDFPTDSVQRENFLRLAERLLGAGGVAAGDLNNDGLPDLFFTASSGKNKLYLNRGGWRFENVTEAAGLLGNKQWSAGVSMADVNGDGWLDLYVCHFGPKAENELFIHSGKLTENGIPQFTEQAQALGLTNNRQAVQSVFFDYDLDGDLDCFVVNNQIKALQPDSLQSWPNGSNRLYRNDKGLFIDVSLKAGLAESLTTTGVAIADFNGDQWPDIALSRDFPETDVIYLNQQKGLFQETRPFLHTPQRSLSIVAGDLDNDAQTDVLATSALSDDAIRSRTQVKFGDNRSLFPTVPHNTLQQNRGDGNYSDRAWMAGVAATDISHGALVFDMDADGWKDIFIPNGNNRDVRDLDFLEKLITDKSTSRLTMRQLLDAMPTTPQSNFAFLNQKAFTFDNQALRLGLAEPGYSNGAAYADLDNDGDWDLIVNQMGKPARMFRNEYEQEKEIQSLKIKFKGPAGNPFGYGTEVRIYAGNTQQKMVMQPNQGYQSSQEPVLLVGLEKETQADSIVINWPGFTTQTLRNVPAKQTLEVIAAQAVPKKTVVSNPQIVKLFSDVSAELLKQEVRHEEDTFSDLALQPYLPRTLSKEGPKMAVGDVNGDGLEDLFITGVKNQAGQLLLQTKTGKWIPSTQKAFLENKYSEEVAAVFVDIDQDHDLDLIVASGGNQSADSSFVRLYLNDGKGTFTFEKERMPDISLNASCLAVADVDKDGDMDVFVGARSVPGTYGVTPKSYLLKNEKGFFKAATPEVLSKIGLITDAIWQDLDGNGYPDLVVVGEWMPISIFYNRGGKFTYSDNQTIPNSEGWWTALKKADLDGDGDMDFVVGNWGLNSEYKASLEQPMYLQVNDFDRNGSLDALLTRADADGEQYPVATRQEWKQQLPNWNTPLLSNKKFAEKSFHQLITASQRRGTLEKKAVEFRTSLLINEGNGNFRLQALPGNAQNSPIFGIAIHDFTKDGKPDILLGGNLWGMPIDRGRLDGNRGTLLINESRLKFNEYKPSRGLLTGQIRDFALVPYLSQYRLFVGRNNGRLLIYALD